MASLNRIILIGRLVKNPEMRHTPNGVPVATFRLAVDRRPSPGGERETDFIDIVTFSKVAESCNNQLTKGRLVAVDGRLQIRSYETKDGQRRRVAEVVAQNVQFLDWPREVKAPEEAVLQKPKEEAENIESIDIETLDKDIGLDETPFANLDKEAE